MQTPDLQKGLNEKEVANLRQTHGENVIDARTVRWWHILLRQLKSPFLYLLVGAGVVSSLLGEMSDGIIIFIFITINTALGFFQEYKSERSLRLLQSFVRSYATVIRSGKEERIESKDIVPGDVVVLRLGDKIPADIRFIETDGCMVDESPLTGESVPINKNVTEKTNDETGQGFAGTLVVGGYAKGVVEQTGRKTRMGSIAKLTVETVHVSGFEKNIAHLSTFILKMTFITLLLVIVANVFLKDGTSHIGQLLVFAVALAVSVIPEALPVVMVFSLSKGAVKLAKKHVAVKRLSAIEDLGGIDVLCTDKTGTITENCLKVVSQYAESDKQTLLCAALAASSGDGKMREPFDAAIMEALPKAENKTLCTFKKIKEFPFDPEQRSNGAIVQNGKKEELIVRGAADFLLPATNVHPTEKKRISEWITAEGLQGHRCMAIIKKTNGTHAKATFAEMLKEKKFELIGLLAFADPIKTSTFDAVKQSRILGLAIKVITGDSKEVAGAVGHQIGLIDDPAKVLTGADFDKLSIKAREKAVEDYSVFARIAPEQKYEIIKHLQNRHQVGFLGEGINDAPSLKIADVSLVVDNASDIARDSADIVMLRKDLHVVIEGIKEGRRVFANTVKYIQATLASNFGNFYAVAVSTLFIDFLPMLPIQILLLNLTTDFPMIAISTDTVDDNDLKQPRNYNLKEIMIISMILGGISSVFDFIFFGLFYHISPEVLHTNWFIASTLTELAFLFSIRTRLFFLRSRFPSLLLFVLSVGAALGAILVPFFPPLATFFKFVPPTSAALFLIVGLVATYFVLSETAKLWIYSFFEKQKKIA